MFNGNAAFNADISKWNTSKAKTMQGMFKDAINFNQDISDWDTSHVENFVSQFEGAERFDQPVGKWNTGSSKSDGMQGMFQRAKSFAQDVSSFTGQASNQNQGMMFSGATAFHARFKCAMPDMGPAATCKDKTAVAMEQQLGQDGLQEDQALTTALVSDQDAPVTPVNEEEGDVEDSISAQSEIKDLEQELEEGEDPELKLQDPEDETVIENGLTYRGKQTHSRSGVECKNWVQTTITPDDNPGQGLESNYCRNPNGMQETIFCFIGNGETEACDAKAEP
jgi:surface protein